MVYEPNLAIDLLCTHNVITRSLEVAAEHCGQSLRSGELDEASKDGFIDYLECIRTVLTTHHHLETQKVFPYFQNKIPELPVKQLNQEHGKIGIHLIKFDDIIPDLKGDSLIPSLEQLNEALTGINHVWYPHKELEEKYFTVEKIGNLLDKDEMRGQSEIYREFIIERYQPDYLVMPFQFYNLPPKERDIWAQKFPEIFTHKLISTEWKDKWSNMAEFFYPDVE
ncbi:MAG TPA: hypothetical protein PLC38_02105 [Methanobacterium sp.]|jgi:hemerythrin-like domain-containing protein|nr:hypothetical protein [Methanobacterium sp.]